MTIMQNTITIHNIPYLNKWDRRLTKAGEARQGHKKGQGTGERAENRIEGRGQDIEEGR